ncbi:hypothetical protein Tco_1271990 [Tanacetum coccineum]
MPPTEVVMAKLAETMAKHYPDLVCKYYPDYPSYTPPPTSKPSRLKESMVTLADTMAKLELASKRLAASTANLVPISTKATTLISTFTTNESNDPTTKPEKTEVVTETSSLITKINKTENTIAMMPADSVSSTTERKNEVATQAQLSLSLLPTLPANPTRKIRKGRHDIAIFHLTNLNETYGVATSIDEKFSIFHFTEPIHRGHQVSFKPPRNHLGSHTSRTTKP